MTKNNLLFFFCFQAIISSAQMNGVYTVGGTNPDYATIPLAVADMIAQGVSGPVKINIRPGVYSGILAIQNLGFTFPVTFTSETNNSSDVTVTMTYLYQCANLNFKNITILPQTDNSYGYPYKGLEFAGSLKLLFDSCVFRGQSNAYNRNGPTLAPSYGKIYIRNCKFYNLDNGVVFSAVKSYYGTNKQRDTNMVVNCFFDSVQTAIRVGGEIGNWAGDTLVISGNMIMNPANGILLDGSNNGFLNRIGISRNNIVNATQEGIFIKQSGGYGFIRVSNNMISKGGLTGVWTSGPQGTFTMSWYKSIHLDNANSIQILNNSIYGSIAATGSAGLVIKNNCIYSDTSLAYSLSTPPFVSDYNNIYADTARFVGFINSHFYSTLDSLRQTYGMDIHSISTYPFYFSNTDLHSYSPYMQFAGTPLSAINDDIDGEARNNPTPDIGADEYHASPLPPFSYFEYQCTSANTLQFNNISVRDTITHWDFGDGVISSALSPAHTYTAGGTYTVSLVSTNFFGLDTMRVTVSMANPLSFTQNNDTLSVPAIYQGYQWYFNGNPIPGATNPTYIMLFPGNYQIRVIDTAYTCSPASPAVFVSMGIEELWNNVKVQVLPNPFSTTATIKIDETIPDKYYLRVYNLLSEMVGRKIESSNNIITLERGSLPPGSYYYSLELGNGTVLNRGPLVIQ